MRELKDYARELTDRLACLRAEQAMESSIKEGLGRDLLITPPKQKEYDLVEDLLTSVVHEYLHSTVLTKLTLPSEEKEGRGVSYEELANSARKPEEEDIPF